MDKARLIQRLQEVTQSSSVAGKSSPLTGGDLKTAISKANKVLARCGYVIKSNGKEGISLCKCKSH